MEIKESALSGNSSLEGSSQSEPALMMLKKTSLKFEKLEETDLKHLNKEFEESDHVTKDKLARKDEHKCDGPSEQNETLGGGLPEIKSVEIKTRKGFSVHRVQEYKGIVLENHAHM